MTYSYFIDDIAQAELAEAGATYVSYFSELGDSAKGKAWANRFYGEYRRRIEELKLNPYRFPVCTVYPFDVVDTEYRSFAVGWFTVFYTVDERNASLIVWHIRSSRSDFSGIRRR